MTNILKGKLGAFRKQVVLKVYHNEANFDITFSYCLFEFRGVICWHICKVLIEKNAKEFSAWYILPCWRKDIKRRHNYVINCYDDTQTAKQKMWYNKLCFSFSKVVEIMIESMEKYKILMKCVNWAIEKLMDNANSWGSHSNEGFYHQYYWRKMMSNTK